MLPLSACFFGGSSFTTSTLVYPLPFGTARHIERRVTGRKNASPTLVVRGSVRVVAAGMSQLYPICAADLQLTDVPAWRALRQSLDDRHEGRRCLLRFRRDPLAYLASLEQSLLTPSLPP